MSGFISNMWVGVSVNVYLFCQINLNSRCDGENVKIYLIKLPMPFKFTERQSFILASARCTAIFIQVNLHASTVSCGSRASKAF